MTRRVDGLSRGRLSAMEAGLLTVAARRGRVSAPQLQFRGDPAGEARLAILERLHAAGLVAPSSGPHDGDDRARWFEITGKGRAALAAADRA